MFLVLLVFFITASLIVWEFLSELFLHIFPGFFLFHCQYMCNYLTRDTRL